MSDAPATVWWSKLWEHFDIGAAAGACVSLWFWLRRQIRRRKAREELEQIKLEAITAAADASRRALLICAQSGAAGYLSDEERADLAVTRHRLDDARERLWIATGHESKRPESDSILALQREWRRTHPRVQDVLRSNDLEDDER